MTSFAERNHGVGGKFRVGLVRIERYDLGFGDGELPDDFVPPWSNQRPRFLMGSCAIVVGDGAVRQVRI